MGAPETIMEFIVNEQAW